MSDELGFDPGAVVEVFERHGVRYVLIGGLAGRAWGSPALTSDLDACYARDDDNIECLVAALRELGAYLRIKGGGGEDLPFQLDAETIRRGLNFTFETHAGPVDVLGMPSGTAGYEELARTAVEMTIAGVRVKVAHLDDLLTMKVAAGRAKDRIHVEILTAVREERERLGLGPEDVLPPS